MLKNLALGAVLVAVVLSGVQPGGLFGSAKAEETGVLSHQPEAVVLRFMADVEASREIATGNNYEARLAHLIPVIANAFDMHAMSAAIVGRSVWQGWSTAEQAGFADVMTEFLAATIVGRLELETNKPTEVLETVAGPRGSQIVLTLSTQQEQEIRVDYRLTQTDGNWAIVDIVADTKVSEVARRRAEFLGIIRAQGHAGIMAAIEKKIQQLERAGA